MSKTNARAVAGGNRDMSKRFKGKATKQKPGVYQYMIAGKIFNIENTARGLNQTPCWIVLEGGRQLFEAGNAVASLSTAKKWLDDRLA